MSLQLQTHSEIHQTLLRQLQLMMWHLADHPLIFILLSQQQLILVYFGSWLQVCLLHHNVWRVTAAII